MCGIIHCKKTKEGKSVREELLQRYRKQKSRGQQGYGFIEMKRGYITGEQRSEEEDSIIKKIQKSHADEILFHHRYPTSTPNFIEATHPIYVSHKDLKYDYYVIHNGVITNDEELKEVQNKQGYKYTTELKKQYVTSKNVYQEIMWNDSEALAIDFAQAIETGKDIEARGSIAVIALQFTKNTKKALNLYYGHNHGNPLKIENNKSLFSLSSETGEDIETNVLFCYNYASNTITEVKKDIGIYPKPTVTAGYTSGYSAYTPTREWVWDSVQQKMIEKKEDKKSKDFYHYSDYEYESYSVGKITDDHRDYDEDDFNYYDEEIQELEDSIRQAYSAGLYDDALELEIELEELIESKSMHDTNKKLFD